MNPAVQWQAQCPHCQARFPIEEKDAHREACEASNRARFDKEVERPKSWAFGPCIVRELFVVSPDGPPQRRYFAGATENHLTRAQLVAYRDLINLALAESPEPLAVVPVAPASPAGTVA